MKALKLDGDRHYQFLLMLTDNEAVLVRRALEALHQHAGGSGFTVQDTLLTSNMATELERLLRLYRR